MQLESSRSAGQQRRLLCCYRWLPACRCRSCCCRRLPTAACCTCCSGLCNFGLDAVRTRMLPEEELRTNTGSSRGRASFSNDGSTSTLHEPSARIRPHPLHAVACQQSGWGHRSLASDPSHSTLAGSSPQPTSNLANPGGSEPTVAAALPPHPLRMHDCCCPPTPPAACAPSPCMPGWRSWRGTRAFAACPGSRARAGTCATGANKCARSLLALPVCSRSKK